LLSNLPLIRLKSMLLRRNRRSFLKNTPKKRLRKRQRMKKFKRQLRSCSPNKKRRDFLKSLPRKTWRESHRKRLLLTPKWKR
jgi:hypothetical protein